MSCSSAVVRLGKLPKPAGCMSLTSTALVDLAARCARGDVTPEDAAYLPELVAALAAALHETEKSSRFTNV